MRHATDPDHVIAVTAILSRERRLMTAARIGVVWGLGHTLTVMIVGAAIIVFKIAIPTRLGLAMEFAVALVLILLGVGAVASLMRKLAASMRGTSPGSCGRARGAARTLLIVHAHRTHSCRCVCILIRTFTLWRIGDESADHGIDHDHRIPAEKLAAFGSRRPLLKSFAVGLVHGLAGSAAIALLVLSAIPQPLWATLYLVIFCAGTIAGMGLITVAIATPFAVTSRRVSWLHGGFVTGSGLLSFGFGLFLAYQIGVD